MMAMRNGDENFYEVKTSKLAMPRPVAVQAWFCVIEGDEGLLPLLWAQADDAQWLTGIAFSLDCSLLIKVIVVFEHTKVHFIRNFSQVNFRGCGTLRPSCQASVLHIFPNFLPLAPPEHCCSRPDILSGPDHKSLFS